MASLTGAAPDVSIIIAAYNVQHYITRAVKNALDQEGVAVEVIVIDDVSTDNTAAIVERMDDGRVKLLRRADNGGPSAARNQGFEAATAPWIAVLDGDDVFAPGRLARCLALAKAKQADILVDNLEVYREADGDRRPMFRAGDFGSGDLLDLATFIKGNASFLGGRSLGYVKPIFSAGFLHRHQLRYDPAVRIGEDYLLMAEALASGARCAVDRTCGYHYTVRARSISHRLSAADAETMLKADQYFQAKFTFDAQAAKAQRRRTFSLNQTLAFTRLVDALKQKQTVSALKIALSRPLAVLQLWEAVWVRIKKLVRK